MLNKIKPKALILIGVLAVCLLLLFILDEKDTESDTQVDLLPEEYQEQLETSLEETIGMLKGVGKVKATVVLDGGYEYVYAINTSKSESNESGQYHKNGDGEPLLLKEIAPKVRGVAIVCEGGDDIALQTKIIELVSNLLDASRNRIFVSG